MSDMSAELEAGFAESWGTKDNPLEPGAKLVGVVTGISRGWSDFLNGYYPIVTIKPEDGSDEKAVHCFHTALRNQMAEWRPKKGERIGIVYGGEKETKSGRNVKVYRVRVAGRDAPEIWESIAGGPTYPAHGPGGREPAPDGIAVDGEDDIPF